MRLSTLPRYLIGSRTAILEIAGAPLSIVVGLLFVVSAGCARTWDTVDLAQRPLAVLRPIGASLASSTAIFVAIYAILSARALASRLARPPLVRSWRAFLSLFWWTAPLAWLYALPVEHVFEAPDAVRANLFLLVLVSAWRVILITRAISVLFEVSAGATFFVVALLADLIALQAIALSDTPVFLAMGGIDPQDAEQVLSMSLFGWQMLLILALVPLVPTALGCAFLLRGERDWSVGEPGHVPRSVWALAGAAIVAWAPLLAVAQPKLQRATELDAMAMSCDADGLVGALAALGPGDVPPLWQPRLTHRRDESGWAPTFARLATLQRASADPRVHARFRSAIDRVVDRWLRRALLPFTTWHRSEYITRGVTDLAAECPQALEVFLWHARHASIHDADTKAELLAIAESVESSAP